MSDWEVNWKTWTGVLEYVTWNTGLTVTTSSVFRELTPVQARGFVF